MDAAGNVVVVGDFSNAIDFGGGSLASAGGLDVFVAKYDANGAHQWSVRLGGTSDDVAYAVAVDGSGSVFVTGGFRDTVDFGGGNLVSAGSYDIFLAKFNASGVHQWSKRFGDASEDLGRGVAVDGSGNVLVTGYFYGTANFGGGNLTSAGSSDIFLAKYDASGVHQWSRRFGGSSEDSGYAVALDGLGNVLVTGYFTGTASLGSGNLVSAGFDDVFLAKYSASGAHQWSRSFGGSFQDLGRGVAVDGAGNVFLTGSFATTANFGGANLVCSGAADIVLAKYTPNGVHTWSKRFGSSGSDFAKGVAVDVSGNVVVTGQFEFSVDFGGTTWFSAGSTDMFVAKFKGNGAHFYSRGFGGTSDDYGGAVAVDGSGNAVVTGWFFSTTMDFGAGNVSNSGGSDIFIAKYKDPALFITQLADVTLDGGGFVHVSFTRSVHDAPGANPLVTQYEAFRRTDTPAGPGWVSVAETPATLADVYEMDAPTDEDSSCASGQHYSYFFIRAQTSTPGVFYDSPIDSGYSVDNLAPGIPTNLVFTLGHLIWDPSTAADFDHFSVYGSTTNSFASATFVDYTTTPGMNVAALPYFYYFVTATDRACNESSPASTGTPTGVGGTPSGYELSISAYPNPFNPETTIRYTVPARGHVTIAVFDARGALVATLVDAVMPRGAHTQAWNGRDDRGNAVSSGVFFARLSTSAGKRTYKMTLLK